ATDHRILPNPSNQPLHDEPSTPETRLDAFPGNGDSLVTTRDLALVWEALAERGVSGADRKAEEFLRKALKEMPDDPRLLTSEASGAQRHGHDKEAQDLYQHAIEARPNANTAATNLGILDARAGELQNAVRLWQQAFQRVPYRSEIGMNLARAFCAAGQKDDARHYVERVLE